MSTSKKKKAWAGRFTKDVAKIVEDFTESISFDQRLGTIDIIAGMAHTLMLEKSKIITKNESQKITTGLKKIMQQIKTKKFKFKIELEDIHMNIESALIKM